MYDSYQIFRPVAVFAGVVGILQSLTWMAMSIVGIIAYYCDMDFSWKESTLGTLFELTFFHVYFRGSCYQEMPQVDFSVLDTMDLMRPVDVHSWMWVYLVLSFFWAISSLTLLIYATHDYIKYVNRFLSIWVIVTVVISAIDLALGVIFSLDYATLMTRAHNVHVEPSAVISQANIALVLAQAAAAIMMTVAFRGYVIWLMNVVLCVYLFVEMLKIAAYNRLGNNYTRRPNAGERNPIDAFGKKNEPNLWITSERPPSAINQPQSLYEDRKRHYEGTVVSPGRSITRPWENDPQRVSVVRELTNRNSQNNAQQPPYNRTASRPEPVNLPDPDYSPTVIPRVNHHHQQQLRNTLKSSKF